jgi:hypothetical protein
MASRTLLLGSSRAACLGPDYWQSTLSH